MKSDKEMEEGDGAISCSRSDDSSSYRGQLKYCSENPMEAFDTISSKEVSLKDDSEDSLSEISQHKVKKRSNGRRIPVSCLQSDADLELNKAFREYFIKDTINDTDADKVVSFIEIFAPIADQSKVRTDLKHLANELNYLILKAAYCHNLDEKRFPSTSSKPVYEDTLAASIEDIYQNFKSFLSEFRNSNDLKKISHLDQLVEDRIYLKEILDSNRLKHFGCLFDNDLNIFINKLSQEKNLEEDNKPEEFIAILIKSDDISAGSNQDFTEFCLDDSQDHETYLDKLYVYDSISKEELQKTSDILKHLAPSIDESKLAFKVKSLIHKAKTVLLKSIYWVASSKITSEFNITGEQRRELERAVLRNRDYLETFFEEYSACLETHQILSLAGIQQHSEELESLMRKYGMPFDDPFVIGRVNRFIPAYELPVTSPKKDVIEKSECSTPIEEVTKDTYPTNAIIRDSGVEESKCASSRQDIQKEDISSFATHETKETTTSEADIKPASNQRVPIPEEEYLERFKQLKKYKFKDGCIWLDMNNEEELAFMNNHFHNLPPLKHLGIRNISGKHAQAFIEFVANATFKKINLLRLTFRGDGLDRGIEECLPSITRLNTHTNNIRILCYKCKITGISLSQILSLPSHLQCVVFVCCELSGIESLQLQMQQSQTNQIELNRCSGLSEAAIDAFVSQIAHSPLAHSLKEIVINRCDDSWPKMFSQSVVNHQLSDTVQVCEYANEDNMDKWIPELG